MNNYKVSYHLRNYIKQELYDYNRNKQIIQELTNQKTSQVATKSLLILTKKVNCIENVYNKLNENDQELFNIIFEKGCNQLYARTYYNVTKDMYYNAMNKIIYLVAQEYEQI